MYLTLFNSTSYEFMVISRVVYTGYCSLRVSKINLYEQESNFTTNEGTGVATSECGNCVRHAGVQLSALLHSVTTAQNPLHY